MDPHPARRLRLERRAGHWVELLDARSRRRDVSRSAVADADSSRAALVRLAELPLSQRPTEVGVRALERDPVPPRPGSLVYPSDLLNEKSAPARGTARRVSA